MLHFQLKNEIAIARITTIGFGNSPRRDSYTIENYSLAKRRQKSHLLVREVC